MHALSDRFPHRIATYATASRGNEPSHPTPKRTCNYARLHVIYDSLSYVIAIIYNTLCL